MFWPLCTIDDSQRCNKCPEMHVDRRRNASISPTACESDTMRVVGILKTKYGELFISRWIRTPFLTRWPGGCGTEGTQMLLLQSKSRVP